MKVKSILFCLLLICYSCVSTRYISYASLDNIPEEKDYFEITNSKQVINFVEVGFSTVYSGRQHNRIMVSFKNSETDSVIIQSTGFGILKQFKKGSKSYFTEDLGLRNFTSDTVYLKYPDKMYTFYLNK